MAPAEAAPAPAPAPVNLESLLLAKLLFLKGYLVGQYLHQQNHWEPGNTNTNILLFLAGSQCFQQSTINIFYFLIFLLFLHYVYVYINRKIPSVRTERDFFIPIHNT